MIVKNATEVFHPKNKEEVFRGVQFVICEATGIVASRVVPEAQFKADLGIDWTFDCMDILFGLERVFGIEIKTGGRKGGVRMVPEFIAATTVQNIIDYICGRLKIENATPAPKSI